MNERSLLHEELSYAVIDCAMAVLNELKPGLDEKAYENALVIQLGTRGMRIEQQRRFDVRYQGALVDILISDLIVNDSIIVDPKVVEDFTPSHFAQMTGYLAITQLRLALILNFKHADLRWKRIIR